jgi:uncharacterized membrane protein YkoI
MKLPRLLKSTTLAFALAVGLSAYAYADDEDEGKDEHEQNVEMKDLPPVVQKTIQDSGGAVTNIEKESEDSKTHYSADVKKDDGSKVEIKVAEDGNLIKVSPDDVKEEESEDED